MILAEAYIRPARSASILTWPGGRVDFRNGVAHLNDERDCVAMLRRADVTVRPMDRYLDFLPKWIRACGEHQPWVAQLDLPEDVTVGPAPDYELIRAAPPPVGDEPEPAAAGRSRKGA